PRGNGSSRRLATKEYEKCELVEFSVACRLQRVHDLEKAELQEIPVRAVEPVDAVLSEHRREMRVGHEIAANDDPLGHRLVLLDETVLLADEPDPRQIEQAADIGPCRIG